MFFEDSSKPRRSGVSKQATSAYSIMNCVCTHIRLEAIKNYRAKYEVGSEEDNPESEFPQDGGFKWSTHKERDKTARKIIYYEGPKDVAWLLEKERNQQLRIERELKALEIKALYGLF